MLCIIEHTHPVGQMPNTAFITGCFVFIMSDNIFCKVKCWVLWYLAGMFGMSVLSSLCFFGPQVQSLMLWCVKDRNMEVRMNECGVFFLLAKSGVMVDQMVWKLRSIITSWKYLFLRKDFHSMLI
jgi:hypothetical protein